MSECKPLGATHHGVVHLLRRGEHQQQLPALAAPSRSPLAAGSLTITPRPTLSVDHEPNPPVLMSVPCVHPEGNVSHESCSILKEDRMEGEPSGSCARASDPRGPCLGERGHIAVGYCPNRRKSCTAFGRHVANECTSERQSDEQSAVLRSSRSLEALRALRTYEWWKRTQQGGARMIYNVCHGLVLARLRAGQVTTTGAKVKAWCLLVHGSVSLRSSRVLT